MTGRRRNALETGSSSTFGTRTTAIPRTRLIFHIMGYRDTLSDNTNTEDVNKTKQTRSKPAIKFRSSTPLPSLGERPKVETLGSTKDIQRGTRHEYLFASETLSELDQLACRSSLSQCSTADRFLLCKLQ